MLTKHARITIAVAFVAFIFGFAAQFMISPARAGTNLTKWEYKCFLADNPEGNGVLAGEGKLGWELVAVAAHAPIGLKSDLDRWCLKRPLP